MKREKLYQNHSEILSFRRVKLSSKALDRKVINQSKSYVNFIFSGCISFFEHINHYTTGVKPIFWKNSLSLILKGVRFWKTKLKFGAIEKYRYWCVNRLLLCTDYCTDLYTAYCTNFRSIVPIQNQEFTLCFIVFLNKSAIIVDIILKLCYNG